MISKTEKLAALFNSDDRVLVAFSGGVDSTFLLFALAKFSGSSVGALTIKTPYIPDWEIDEAAEIAGELGVSHAVLQLPFPETVRDNPEERCYLCKTILFNMILEYASANGYNYVVDGTNADDAGQHRPGMKALAELKIRSPLKEAGLGKAEIRQLLKENGMKVWDKPAYACLLTRIPYNTRVDDNMLRTVERAERFIHKSGFPGTRVRLHGDIARIEPPPKDIARLVQNPGRSLIIDELKKLGIRYITLDLEGYRTGSLDK